MQLSDDAGYIQEKLEWVKYRLAMLDIIEGKLKQMRDLAEYARDNLLSELEKAAMNTRLSMLGKDVAELDNQSRKFWQENQ